jgi:hypothetical protein
LAAIPLVIGLAVAGAAAVPQVSGSEIHAAEIPEVSSTEPNYVGSEGYGIVVSCGSVLRPMAPSGFPEPSGVRFKRICREAMTTRREVTLWAIAVGVGLSLIVWFVLAAVELLRETAPRSRGSETPQRIRGGVRS